jgi:uncharacterized protein involved in exopolysaccharide biosynthesis
LSSALDTLQQKAIEAHLKEAEALSNVFVVDSPHYPMSARFPSILQIWLLALLLGPLGAWTLCVTRHRLNRTWVALTSSSTMEERAFPPNRELQPV